MIRGLWRDQRTLERDQNILGIWNAIKRRIRSSESGARSIHSGARSMHSGERPKDDRMVKSRRQEMCRNSCKQNLITSYLPAGRGAPKAWKDWGNGGGAISGFSKRFQRKNISSVVTVTCYSGCLSATTPLPTPQLGPPAAHSDRFPTSIHPMGPCSFDFSKFYRVGCEINEHQPLQ